MFEKDSLNNVKEAIDKLKSIASFSEPDVCHTWYLYPPTVRLLQQVGTMLGVFKERKLQLELYTIALGWERETKEEMQKSAYCSNSTIASINEDYNTIMYESAKLYFEEGYSLIAEQIVDRIIKNQAGKNNFKTKCFAAILRAHRPRGQAEYLNRLKDSLDSSNHPLQLIPTSEYRTIEEACVCAMTLSKLHDLVGNTREAFFWGDIR